MWDDDWERGWRGSDKFICRGCADEDYLGSVVADAALSEQECSFCGAAPAADFDAFMEAFMVGIGNSFEQADDVGMPWEAGTSSTRTTHTMWQASSSGLLPAPTQIR